MNESKVLEADLYQELQYWLSKNSDDEFQQDYAKLTRSCDILEKFNEHCVNKWQQHQFNSEELIKRSKLLLESLRAYRNDTDHYSVHTILIKLELILFDVIDNNSTSDEKATPNIILTDIYSMKNNEEQGQQSEITEDEEEAKSDERLYLLNELMDAPLDDIITFMHQKDWSFEQFYTYEIFDQILYRLQNPAAFSNSSHDIIDQLCVYIKKKLKKKYHLTRTDFISLLADQFNIITPNKYRIYLEKFVINNKTATFTLESFYSFHKIPTVLSKDDEKFATLFSIYCEKLLGEDKSQRTRRPVHNVSRTNRQEEVHANFSRPYQQNEIGKSTNYRINPLKYDVQKQKSIESPSQNADKLEHKTVTSNGQYQKQQNKYRFNNYKMRSGYQMSLSNVY